MASLVIEVTDFNSEARCNVRGCLEAAMASEATKMAVWGNMHNDTRVIEIADFKSEVKFEFWGHWGCFEAAMASEATKMAVRGNMHNDTRVIEVADFKSEAKYDFSDHCHCCPLV